MAADNRPLQMIDVSQDFFELFMVQRPCLDFFFHRDGHIDGFGLRGFPLGRTRRFIGQVEADMLFSRGAMTARVAAGAGDGDQAAVDKGADGAEFSQEGIAPPGIEFYVIFGVHT